MSYSLSLLDKSPIADGANAADALRFTTTLARRAEQLGYARFWVAEHHGTPGFA
ncbi:LLM class flavin-dependent oxidoreductase, partial [Burkholderia sp. E168m30]